GSSSTATYRATTRSNGAGGPLAGIGGAAVRGLATRAAALIRVDEVWLAVGPLDLRAGMESMLVRVVNVFGAARLSSGAGGGIVPITRTYSRTAEGPG